MQRVRVLLVDDHKILRQGMRRLLELDEGIEVVGEAESGEQALALAASASPNVVLMDIRIPDTDGIEATKQIRKSHPEINVIILTSYGDEYLEEAVEAGAAGYLLKSVGHDELTQAVRAVSEGEAVIDRSLGREFLRRFADLTRVRKQDVLSDRQVDVLRLLAAGLSSKDITERLFISNTTLKRELRHIFARLGVDKRTQAIAEAYRRRLI